MKYRNIKTVVDGITFDSKKEAKRYNELKLLKQAGIIEAFDIKVKYPYIITYSANGKTYTRNAYYESDFVVYYKDRIEVEDVKGVQTPIFKQKKRIMKALYNFDIILK